MKLRAGIVPVPVENNDKDSTVKQLSFQYFFIQ
jgi:hypothetical protein